VVEHLPSKRRALSSNPSAKMNTLKYGVTHSNILFYIFIFFFCLLMYIPVCEDKVPTQERFSSYAFKKHGLTHVMTLSGTHTQCHRDSRANGVLFPTLGSPAGPGPPSSPPEQSCPAAWLPGEHAVPLLHLPPTSAQLSANTHPSVSPEGGQSQGTEKGLWKAPQMLKYSTC
jgi:hypothetical protein